MDAVTGSRLPGESSQSLADLIEQAVACVKAGKELPVEALAGARPEWAAVLRDLVPGLRLLGSLESSTSRDEIPSDPSLPSELSAPIVLGDYRVSREIGRGGMGVVYEAWQITLKRRVALKVLPLAAALDPKTLGRFKIEAQAAASLHHAHIVPVYQVGCENGVHFYAMQFIEGRSLAELITNLHESPANGATPNQSPLPVLRERVRVRAQHPAPDTATLALAETTHSGNKSAYFRTVAGLARDAALALHYAHQAGVVHRDIKPANLLIDSNLHIWVTDFGLARLQTEVGLTMTGDLVGTLRYMSPEQALGKGAVLDERCDVYGLGATLFELLTLRPAYPGVDRQELLRKIAFDEPPGPQRIDRSIPIELDTIVRKAMAKRAEDRYARAQDLADDLQRFLDHKPVRARRPTPWEVGGKWVRRHTAAVGALVAVLLVTILALATSLVFISFERAETVRQKSVAEEETRISKLREASLTWSNYVSEMQLLGRDWQNLSTQDLEARLNHLRPLQSQEDPRGWEWYYLWRLAHITHKSFQAHKPNMPVHWMTFSPDGTKLVTTSKDSTVRVWKAATLQPMATLTDHTDEVNRAAFSPDSKTLATTSDDGTVRLWDMETYRCKATLDCYKGEVHAVAISPDGRWLIAASRFSMPPKLWMWDLKAATLKPAWEWVPFDVGEIHSMAFLPGANGCIIGGNWLHHDESFRSGYVARLQFPFDAPHKTEYFRSTSIGPLALNKEGDRMAFVSDWGLEALSTDGFKPMPGWLCQLPTARRPTFSPDGRLVALVTGQNQLLVTEARNPQAIRAAFRLGGMRIWSTSFSPDSRKVLVGRDDGSVLIVDALGYEEDEEMLGHEPVEDFAASSDGRWLLTNTKAGAVKLWNASTLNLEQVLAQKGTNDMVAIASDGSRSAAYLGKGRVALWEKDSGWREKAIQATPITEDWTMSGWNIVSFCFLPGDRHLFVGTKTLGAFICDTKEAIYRRVSSAEINVVLAIPGNRVLFGRYGTNLQDVRNWFAYADYSLGWNRIELIPFPKERLTEPASSSGGHSSCIRDVLTRHPLGDSPFHEHNGDTSVPLGVRSARGDVAVFSSFDDSSYHIYDLARRSERFHIPPPRHLSFLKAPVFLDGGRFLFSAGATIDGQPEPYLLRAARKEEAD